MAMRLTIEVLFADDLTERAQADVKRAVQDFKESMYLGTVTRANLVKIERPSAKDDA